MDPTQLVRDTTAVVVSRASHVVIKDEQITVLAKKLVSSWRLDVLSKEQSKLRVCSQMVCPPACMMPPG